MLILSRKVDKSVVVGEGDDTVTVTVVEIKGDKVRLGFEGPRNIPIDREEVRVRKENSIVQ